MAKYQFFVLDWNPNGTNDVLVMSGNEQVEYIQECLFGIDVNTLGKPQYPGNDDVPVYRVSKELVKKHVACAPMAHIFERNCAALKPYLSE